MTAKIKKNDLKFILFLILIFPFFRITYLTANFAIVNKIYLVFQILAFLIIVFILTKNKNFKLSKVNLVIILYFIVLNFSTILNNASIFECLYLSFRVITFCLIVEYGLRFDTENFLKAVKYYFVFSVLLNFLSILIYPNGMYIDKNVGYHQNWILGYKNIHILFIIPAILFSFLYSYYKFNKLKLRNYLFLLISIVSIIMVDSSTSLVGLLTITAFIIFNKLFNKDRIFNIKNYLIFIVSLFLGIIVFKIQEKFKFIIENIFHRSLNFTNRTYIWEYVIDFIKKKPLIGYGVENQIVRYNKTTYLKSIHAHNEILEIIYKSGIIGLAFFSYIVILCTKELMKDKDNIIVKFVSVIFFTYALMMLTEVYSYEYFMFLFVICYNIKYLLKRGKNENNIEC